MLHDGVVSRGVLLDVARTRGVRWLDPGEGVMPGDLEAAERAAGVRVEPGDILRGPHRLLRAPARRGAGAPDAGGVAGAARGPVAVAQGAGRGRVGKRHPQRRDAHALSRDGQPFHIGALVGLGLWLIDNMNLEDIAKACADRSRWEFLLTLAPLRLRNVTGSPLNPIALF